MLRKLTILLKRIIKLDTNDKSQVASRARMGFTLTEVVIASAILIVAMVPILKALTTAHVTGTSVERKTHSLSLAQAKLEGIKARSVYNYPAGFAETSEPLEAGYLCTVTDTGPSADLRTIALSVGYDQDGDNSLEADEIEVTLNTLLAKRW
jgi:type II secretory pathway pseudopilin PulG